VYICAECRSALCRSTEWHSDKCHGAIVVSECHSYGWCHSDECRSDDCHGAIFISKRAQWCCHSAAYPSTECHSYECVAPFCARLWATVMPSGILISILSKFYGFTVLRRCKKVSKNYKIYATLKKVNSCLNTNNYSYLETSGGQSSNL
jgi:hypothetical protein